MPIPSLSLIPIERFQLASHGFSEFDKETSGVGMTWSDKRGTVRDEVANVFVVDDDAAVGRALGRLLRSAGYKPETFASAEDFLKGSPFEAPGRILVDIKLAQQPARAERARRGPQKLQWALPSDGK
jgi:PleD family two-component response regulator